jgi:hypothetical protein
MKTLKLFNCVLSRESKEQPYVDTTKGFIIMPNAMWAIDKIVNYYNQMELSGEQLNATFHKSWGKIENSTRLELAIQQMLHYLSTYGTGFLGETYLPNEPLELPDVKVKFKVISAISEEEMIEKCIDLLRSGVALAEDTINDVLSILVSDCGYNFTGKEGIRNKEAMIKIGENYNVYPENPVEFLRLILYKTTGETLLIKNSKTINAINASNYNPAIQFNRYGLVNLSRIFNRFKPIFLAYKDRCGSVINKISKLSKIHHEPMVVNPLNEVTSYALADKDLHWLYNATPYALFKALSALHSRMNGQTDFTYRIRNGKSWVVSKGDDMKYYMSTWEHNYSIILSALQKRFEHLVGKKVYQPEFVKYSLPTSEKMFVGNIPTGTRFYAENMAVGMYWENDWGARDLDLSGLNIGGKIGWNASYGEGGGKLIYSGDITNAPNGAVEYLYAKKQLREPTLVNMNVFSGSQNSGYQIIIGAGDEVSKDYMMNPNNLMVQIRTEAVQKQMVLGMLIPKKKGQCFVLLNFGQGSLNVSRRNDLSMTSLSALYQQWNKPLTLKKVLKYIGCVFVDKPEDADIDLSIETLEKDSFTRLFS